MAVSNADLSDKLDELLTAVQAIATANAARDAREVVMKKQVDDHETALNGNGKLGLKAQVELLKDNATRVNWLGGLVLVAIIGDALSRILAAAK